MQKYFLDLKSYVEHQYPEFQGNIEGGLYPPPPHATLISNIAGYVWIAGIGLLVGGSSLFRALGLTEPPIITWMNSNKVGAFFILFMMNNIANSLLATGAFEVYLNDELIFSKLQSKRFPSVRDINSLLTAYGYNSDN
jgi:selT/selW/selH-like putative selenoprotein